MNSKKTKLLLELASAFEKRAEELAKVNSADTGTSYYTNLENLKRGVATIRAFSEYGDKEIDSTGIALFSCYNDPSFALLGMNLAPAILACGDEYPILIGFPSILQQYSKLFKKIIEDTGLLPNITFTSGINSFFDLAFQNSNIQDAVIFGDEWIHKYANKWADSKRAMIFYGPGNNASVILQSANLDVAIEKTLESAFILSGQAAVCINRCYVDNRINEEEIKAIFLEKLEKISYGWDSTNFVTPVKIQILADIINKRVEQSLSMRAEAIQFGIKTKGNDTLIKPSIVWEKSADTQLLKEYHFAPVLPVLFCDANEIVKQVNSSNYGIYTSVWANDDKFATIKDELLKKHILVTENSSILNIITPENGYTGLWGGYGKSGFYFSKETGFIPKNGRINLLALLTNR